MLYDKALLSCLPSLHGLEQDWYAGLTSDAGSLGCPSNFLTAHTEIMKVPASQQTIIISDQGFL
jgi:hypothetical protein